MVWVIPHEICRVVIDFVNIENGSGGSSPACISSAFQSIVLPSKRGGVPVLRRPSVKPKPESDSESAIAGASPILPAGIRVFPIWINPFRNVPVVRITEPAPIIFPFANSMPVTWLFSFEKTILLAMPSMMDRFSSSSRKAWMAFL